MKRNISFLLLIMGFMSLTAQSLPDTIRVMTYNLRFGELASMQEIASYIKSENPDLVALQEVDWKTNRERAPRQNGVAMINELAYHTGMFGLYGKSIDYRAGYYGLGVLSKYPILSYRRVLLPNPEPKKEQRSMLIADIEMPDNKIVTFVCTHLEVSDEEKRIKQIRFIHKETKNIAHPVILAGDFNARPYSKLITSEMKKWINASNEENTYHTADPTIKIDYIYYLPNRGLEMIDTRRGSVKLSDHFPLITNFSLK